MDATATAIASPLALDRRDRRSRSPLTSIALVVLLVLPCTAPAQGLSRQAAGGRPAVVERGAFADTVRPATPSSATPPALDDNTQMSAMQLQSVSTKRSDEVQTVTDIMQSHKAVADAINGVGGGSGNPSAPCGGRCVATGLRRH